jgi:hypothetical protein
MDLESDLPASLDTYWHSAQSDHNCSMVPPHNNSMHCCSFVVATVQSKETKSWGIESVTKFEIPELQLASFDAY